MLKWAHSFWFWDGDHVFFYANVIALLATFSFQSLCYSFCFLLHQALSPCGLSDTICGRATEWASNGTELCHFAGFAVQPDRQSIEGHDEPFCYGGKASLESISHSWKSPQSRSRSRTSNLWVLEDFQQWVRDMPISEKVFWAVGGMVLTAGLLLIRLVLYQIPCNDWKE